MTRLMTRRNLLNIILTGSYKKSKKMTNDVKKDLTPQNIQPISYTYKLNENINQVKEII